LKNRVRELTNHDRNAAIRIKALVLDVPRHQLPLASVAGASNASVQKYVISAVAITGLSAEAQNKFPWKPVPSSNKAVCMLARIRTVRKGGAAVDEGVGWGMAMIKAVSSEVSEKRKGSTTKR